jgi:hypothetical protein
MVAIIDWYSRYIVGFALLNTLEKTFILETVKKAIKKHGAPEIINSDQGSQFTSEKYVELLKANGIKISMDGKGRGSVITDRKTKGYSVNRCKGSQAYAYDERAKSVLALDIC